MILLLLLAPRRQLPALFGFVEKVARLPFLSILYRVFIIIIIIIFFFIFSCAPL
jgi:hypothetical protein